MSLLHRGNHQHDLDDVLSPRLSARFVRHLLADEEAIDDAVAAGPRPATPVPRSGCLEAAIAADRLEQLVLAAATRPTADTAPAVRALGTLAAIAGRTILDGAARPAANLPAPAANLPAAHASGLGAIVGGGVAAYAARARVAAGSYDLLARAIAAVTDRIDRAVEDAGALARELGSIEAIHRLVATGPIDAATLSLVDGIVVATSLPSEPAPHGSLVDEALGPAATHDVRAWTETFFDAAEAPPATAPNRAPPAATTSQLAAALTSWAAAHRAASSSTPVGDATPALDAPAAAGERPAASALAQVVAGDELMRLREAGDLTGLVEALGVRGASALERGAWPAAMRLLEEAAAVNAAVQRPAHAAQAMIGVTVALRGSGRTAEAAALARRAVALAPGGPSKVAALAALGSAARAAGHDAAAVSAFDDALARGRAAGLLPDLVAALERARSR